MGIKGLLKVLQPITRQCNVSEFEGQTVAVDAFCWLHKASYGCAKDLVLGKATTKYVDYCMKLVNLLLYHNIKPILVFDGGKLPMKAAENRERNRNRQKAEEKARNALRENDLSTAIVFFQRAVRITREMVRMFIEALKQNGVEYIVAPYEADAQMAYMTINNLVDFCITEDSDLLTFGVKRILFKMDATGQGDFIDLDTVKQYKPPRNEGSGKNGKNGNGIDFVANLRRFSDEHFLYTCIFSGCDYLKSLPGMGLKTAQKFVKDHGMKSRIFKWLRRSKKKVSKSYEAAFERAELTFKHQRVYDPRTKRVVHLTELPSSVQPLNVVKMEDNDDNDGKESEEKKDGEKEEKDSNEDVEVLDLTFDFLGPPIDDSLAEKLAIGELNPYTLKPYTTTVTYTPSSFSPSPSGPAKSPKKKVPKTVPVSGFHLSKHRSRRQSTNSMLTTPAKRPGLYKRSQSAYFSRKRKPAASGNLASIVNFYSKHHSSSSSSSSGDFLSSAKMDSDNKENSSSSTKKRKLFHSSPPSSSSSSPSSSSSSLSPWGDLSRGPKEKRSFNHAMSKAFGSLSTSPPSTPLPAVVVPSISSPAVSSPVVLSRFFRPDNTNAAAEAKLEGAKENQSVQRPPILPSPSPSLSQESATPDDLDMTLSPSPSSSLSSPPSSQFMYPEDITADDTSGPVEPHNTPTSPSCQADRYHDNSSSSVVCGGGVDLPTPNHNIATPSRTTRFKYEMLADEQDVKASPNSSLLPINDSSSHPVNVNGVTQVISKHSSSFSSSSSKKGGKVAVTSSGSLKRKPPRKQSRVFLTKSRKTSKSKLVKGQTKLNFGRKSK